LAIGQVWSSEKRGFLDEKTGRQVWQLTSNGSNNYHLYFTDNSFTLGDRDIYFLSDRASSVPGVYNFFHMDLITGVITQVTDEPGGIQRHTKSPDSEWLVYNTKNMVKKFNTRTKQSEVIYEEKEKVKLGSPFISPCKKYVGVIRNEDVNIERGANYSGFKESLFAIKRAWITLVMMDGSKAFDVWEDTHYLHHFQFAPDDSNLALFCHEGPWNLVHQRMWLLDIPSRSVKPCFRQGEDDCVGHEFWTRDGMIFFDNRRRGHDGTITSSRTQATIQPEPDSGQIPYVGLANKQGEVVRTIELPYYCNHYHANNDNSLLVGDEVDDLVLIDLKQDKPVPVTLCTHHTSWLTNRTHVHPTFSWSGNKILFASDRDVQKINLYLIELMGGS
jgi:oligogalacturonide lyase